MSAPTMNVNNIRNGDLVALSGILQDVRARAVDVVLPGNRLSFQGGLLRVAGVAPQLSEDGVTPVDGMYLPTVVGQEGLATKLDVPLGYLRRMSEPSHTGLLDENLNHWLSRDERTFLVRLLRGGDGPADGFMRALLSDRYFTIDNLDVVLAALQGVQQADVDPATLKIAADLTDRRMYVRVTSDTITTSAEALVRNYRDPRTGRRGEDHPLVSAGFRISNSEVGQGGFNITPFATFLVCKNGMTRTKDALTKVHLGGRLDEGVIAWSKDTTDKALALVTAQTRDAVAAFLSVEYLDSQLDELRAHHPDAAVDDAPKVIEAVSRKLGFDKTAANSILNAFIDGGQRTNMGVLQAVTYVAQHHPDADVAADMQDKAIESLQFAASVNR